MAGRTTAVAGGNRNRHQRECAGEAREQDGTGNRGCDEYGASLSLFKPGWIGKEYSAFSLQENRRGETGVPRILGACLQSRRPKNGIEGMAFDVKSKTLFDTDGL